LKEIALSVNRYGALRGFFHWLGTERALVHRFGAKGRITDWLGAWRG